MRQIIVVGGGAAGMMSAIFAARNGCSVILLEKNEKCGKKLYITGKGRCNVTNASDVENLLKHVPTNRKFLYSAFYSFDSFTTMAFFEELGLPLKVERGDRVFPVSDKSYDVIDALVYEMRRLGVDIRLGTAVDSLLMDDTGLKGVRTTRGIAIYGDAVIVATGGLSYASTGSTGDGYKFARAVGHHVTPLTPALVPMEIEEDYGPRLQGLTLKNVVLSIKEGKKEVFNEQGEMLFTHFGISGPLILSGSSHITNPQGKEVTLFIDLKPALSEEVLDQRLIHDFAKYMNKDIINGMDELLPMKMIPVVIEQAGIDPRKKINEITKEERLRLLNAFKCFKMTFKQLRTFKEAVITRGGVTVKEINPSTMESLVVSNLYFCGEVLDLDAYTGGFNLQIAYSTGYLAAQSASIER